MTEHEALVALATPAPEPFQQVKWSHDDFVKWDKWNARRLEALKVAERGNLHEDSAADEPGETPA